MKVEWLPKAERNLEAHVDYIAEYSPRAAIAVGNAVVAAAGQLADYPESARNGRVAGTRERPVAGTPYVLIYRIEASAIVILRVLHGAQQWPEN